MKPCAIQIYEDILNGKRKRFPHSFWREDENKNFEDSAIITKYLIEEILKWDDVEIKEKLCCQTFFDNKLKGMLSVLFNDSFFLAINNAYPGKYHEWEFSCTPRNFWNKENAKKATIWLLKDHLKLDDKKILQSASRKLFVDNGLDTMMHVVFKNNATEAINNAFDDIA